MSVCLRRWEVTSSVNVCMCIFGALVLLFFLEKIYSALTKSSEGLGAMNLISRTEERK